MTDEDTKDDDVPSDIVSITADDYNAVRLQSGFFGGEFKSTDKDETEFGIQIHQDGPDIALSAGTVWSPKDEPELYSYHALTVEQAREIADGLNKAADAAEESAQKSETPEKESNSLIRRLLG